MNWIIKHLIAMVASLLFISEISAFTIQDKVLICGICRNIEKSVPNTIFSINKLKENFLDFRVIIYENNSTDLTKELLHTWSKEDPRIIFLSEDLSVQQLADESRMKKANRTEMLARARNIVLDKAMEQQFDDFKYVIWADLDLPDPWDVENIIDTILNEECEWDAVLANGDGDLFALRDSEFPIGFELIGPSYWHLLGSKIRPQLALSLKRSDPWRKVYSAFGWLGIYKRDAIHGCRYSGTVTKELESLMITWLEIANKTANVCLLPEYNQLLASARIIDLSLDRMPARHLLPQILGVRLHNDIGLGKVTWFSAHHNYTLPWTCEHIPFHASMILRGHDKIFINPRIVSIHP